MTDVLVVGDGPTGLRLACELAPEPLAGSGAKGTQPRTMEVFDHLGIADEVAAAVPGRRRHPSAHRGGVPAGDPIPRSPLSRALFVVRPDGMAGLATDRANPSAVLAWLRDAGLLAGRL